MDKKNIVILLLLMVCIIQTGYGQQEGDGSRESVVISQPKKSVSYEQCIKNFDPKKVNFKDPVFKEHLATLWDHYLCRAAARHDVQECEKLGAYAVKCQRAYSRMFGFFGSLAANGEITEDVLKNCKFPLLAEGRTACNSLAEAFVRNDESYCDDISNKKRCSALITLNASKADGEWVDIINCVKAIKDANREACSKIKDKALLLACKAYIDGKEKLCDDSEGYKQFSEIYCRISGR